MTKVQFVTGLHGDEKLPIVALASIGENQIIANYLALAKNKRYVEKDMNASFGTGGNTYEDRQARKLLKKLDGNKNVVDFHTNQSMEEPFVIIVDKKMLTFASKMGIPKVVYMKFNIKKGRSLIDHHNGVSVEVGKHDSIESINKTIEVANNVKKNTKCTITLYEVFGMINKPGKYVNFKMHKSGFVPLFAGGNSYKCYGLKANIIKSI